MLGCWTHRGSTAETTSSCTSSVPQKQILPAFHARFSDAGERRSTACAPVNPAVWGQTWWPQRAAGCWKRIGHRRDWSTAGNSNWSRPWGCRRQWWHADTPGGDNNTNTNLLVESYSQDGSKRRGIAQISKIPRKNQPTTLDLRKWFVASPSM